MYPICNTPVMETTLEQRLVRAADGDQLAFAGVYGASSSRVFGLVLRILADRALAEEVVHEVYLEAWRHAKRFDAERGSAIAWLLQIAHSRAVDRVRLGIRDVRASVDVVVEHAEVSIGTARARRALAQLSVQQREAIELAYFHGFTQSEIAERAGAALATIRTRLRDGMVRLRVLLAATP